jgi:hypothetical protein
MDFFLFFPAQSFVRLRRSSLESEFGFDLADSHFLLSCPATTRFSGSLRAVSAETPDCVQEAAMIVGFVFRTHRGCEAVQRNAAIRVIAIRGRLNWVRFFDIQLLPQCDPP